MGLVVYGRIDKMATEIYKIKNIKNVNGIEIEIVPLKIKYLRELMSAFEAVQSADGDDSVIKILVECVRISMKQFFPEYSVSVEVIEENFDIPTLYSILDVAAGIVINKGSEEDIKEKVSNRGSSWTDLDLAKLESEVFLLGIWKDYMELETSLSMPELMAILSSKRELDYEEKKFLAAIQGVDLEAQSGGSRGQKEWEDMKARVFSGGQTADSNDILALQGPAAQKAGFGIGMGIDYDDLRDPEIIKN